MVTSKKTSRAKPARKTPAKAPAVVAAKKSSAVPTRGELGKLLTGFKLPGIDVAAIVESQRKDMEALADANRQAYEGIKALNKRRNEMLKEALANWRTEMKGSSGKEALSKQAELARKGVQEAIANLRELADMEAKSRKKAWKVVQDRFEENLGNLKRLLQPK
jgi:phasin family protein